MKNTTLGDLKLYLRTLLTDQLFELRASVTGQLYEPRLRAKKEAIEALPDGALSKSPFADELSAEDVIHDGIGAAVIHVCQAILAHPSLPPATRQAAETVRSSFIADLAELQRSYADEAAAALSNRPRLAKHMPVLMAVPVPGGGSLFDWVTALVDSGDTIDVLLRKRAEVLAMAENASATGPLRGATVGLLMRFREALRDETADAGSTLPAGYEARLFAYLDKLSVDRTAAAARRAAASPEPEASAKPDASPKPEASAKPEASPRPDASAKPEASDAAPVTVPTPVIARAVRAASAPPAA